MREPPREKGGSTALSSVSLGASVPWDPSSVAGAILSVSNLSIWYGKQQALRKVTLKFPFRRVTAVIGPSGCGKSTLIRCLNRMNDLVPHLRIEGEVLFHGRDIYARDADPVEIRRRIGMVFQKPNPFPKSIYENVAFGLRVNGLRDRMDERVETALRRAALWDEVKDCLRTKGGFDLSGGQQQRLCLARALAVEPEVLLMDEPCSALDPVATAKIEDLIRELKKEVTIVIVTHNMQQAARISDDTAFLLLGDLIEFAATEQLFTRPCDPRTEAYITGKFG